MAYVEHKTCPVCKTEALFVDGRCRECADNEAHKERVRWSLLPADEKIEELKARVVALERYFWRGPLR